MTKIIFSTLVLALTLSCSSKSPIQVQTSQNSPLKEQEVVILGLNDLHGALEPITRDTNDKDPKKVVRYSMGGAAVIATYVNRIKARYGNNLLILDAGDQWQGTLESNLVKGKSVVEFYNRIGVHAAAIGNHEFDFGAEEKSTDTLSVLKNRMKEAKYPYLSANTFEKKSGKRLTATNLYPHWVLNAGAVKVGVIGVTTETTPATTHQKNISHLEFKKIAEVTKEEAKLLREQEKVDVIVLVAHAGANCHTHKTNPRESVCKESDEMVRVLKELPTGTVDAVVAGHTHTLLHHWIQGVPVIQSGKSLLHLNLIHLTVDLATRKVKPERTTIEGPIPVCEHIFENQKNCDGNNQNKNRGEYVKAKFYGSEVQKDSGILNYLAEAEKELKDVKNQVVGYAKEAFPYNRTSETALGNLIADAMRNKAKSHVAIMNAGGVRFDLKSGDLKKEDTFRVMPFDNTVSILKVTGKELKMIVRVSENGSRGIFPVSGIKVALFKEIPKPTEDLNKDGKLEPWEANRVASVTFSDGKAIDDNAHYTIAMPDFIVAGGDDLAWVMSQISENNKDIMGAGLIRDAIESEIADRTKASGGITTGDYINKTKPRISFK